MDAFSFYCLSSTISFNSMKKPYVPDGSQISIQFKCMSNRTMTNNSSMSLFYLKVNIYKVKNFDFVFHLTALLLASHRGCYDIWRQVLISPFSSPAILCHLRFPFTSITFFSSLFALKAGRGLYASPFCCKHLQWVSLHFFLTLVRLLLIKPHEIHPFSKFLTVSLLPTPAIFSPDLHNYLCRVI